MREFREVVPGVLIAGDIQMSIPHPDPAWLVSNSEEDRIFTNSEGQVPVFTSSEAAKTFIDATGIEGAKPFGPHSWDKIVDKLGGECDTAIIDHQGTPGFYQYVPLKKGI